jgi:hypothetical protein
VGWIQRSAALQNFRRDDAQGAKVLTLTTV